MSHCPRSTQRCGRRISRAIRFSCVAHSFGIPAGMIDSEDDPIDTLFRHSVPKHAR